MFWRRDKNADSSAATAGVRLRDKYISFRRLLALNSECLELMAGLQSDLASIITGSLASPNSVVRALGERSYLLVADEYMNSNDAMKWYTEQFLAGNYSFRAADQEQPAGGDIRA